MRKQNVFAVSLVLLLVLSAPFMVMGAQDESEKKVPVIVMFKERQDLDLVRELGGQAKIVYRFQPAVAAVIPVKAIDALRGHLAVEYVVPDLPIELVVQTLPWGIERIGAVAVHFAGNKGTGINVAVLDTGIDKDHPDLQYVYGYDFSGGNDADPEDFDGHGTHVAGIIAALDNDIGVIGVAPEADLYILKIFTDGGKGSYSDAVEALEWCIGTYSDGIEGNEIQVISMSWGSKKQYGDPGIESWINQAYDLGILLIGAAGNEGNVGGGGDNVIYPARYENVIAVAATDGTDTRALWSSTGPAIELAAPGVSIYSTYKGGGYITMSGTSMACPHVSGTAALVLASTLDPNYDLDNDGVWDNNEVRKKLQDTADDLGDPGRDSKYGYGLVDAVGAAQIEWFRGNYITPWPYPYDSTQADTVLLDLVNVHSNYIALNAHVYQDIKTSITIELDVTQDLALTHMIGDVHTRGLKVVLTIFLLVKDGTWRGHIEPIDISAWFTSCRTAVNHYAELAQTNGVELLVIGSELETMKGYNDEWMTTISQVRAKYGGRVSYNQNWWHSDSEYNAVLSCTWFKSLDYIGISGFFELTTKNNPTLDELVAAWSNDAHGRNPVADLKNLVYTFKRLVVFTEIGYRSIDGANKHPWDYTTDAAIDLQEQADCYEALFEVFHDKPWFRGTLFWAWSTDPNEGGSTDKGYVVRGKPAQTVLFDWYATIASY